MFETFKILRPCTQKSALPFLPCEKSLTSRGCFSFKPKEAQITSICWLLGPDSQKVTLNTMNLLGLAALLHLCVKRKVLFFLLCDHRSTTA